MDLVIRLAKKIIILLMNNRFLDLDSTKVMNLNNINKHHGGFSYKIYF